MYIGLVLKQKKCKSNASNMRSCEETEVILKETIHASQESSPLRTILVGRVFYVKEVKMKWNNCKEYCKLGKREALCYL